MKTAARVALVVVIAALVVVGTAWWALALNYAAIWAASFLVPMVWWATIRPSNDREWAPEVARQPRVDVAGDRLTFHNVRNFDYRSETDFDARWEDRTVDLARPKALDLSLSYWGSPAIAHTILTWSFEGGPPIAISIETRKEHVDSHAPPFFWRMLVNGYGDEMLYERRRIDTSLPFAELRERSRIDAKARAADRAPDFAARIRERLVAPKPRTGPR